MYNKSHKIQVNDWKNYKWIVTDKANKTNKEKITT